MWARVAIRNYWGWNIGSRWMTIMPVYARENVAQAPDNFLDCRREMLVKCFIYLLVTIFKPTELVLEDSLKNWFWLVFVKIFNNTGLYISWWPWTIDARWKMSDIVLPVGVGQSEHSIVLYQLVIGFCRLWFWVTQQKTRVWSSFLLRDEVFLELVPVALGDSFWWGTFWWDSPLCVCAMKSDWLIPFVEKLRNSRILI